MARNLSLVGKLKGLLNHEYFFPLSLTLIVSLAPFWRGLFFSSEQLAFSVPIFLIGIVWFWRLKQNLKMESLDWAVVVLSGMYILSNLVAQNRYQALTWALQMAAMAVIYFILSREMTGKRSLMHIILGVMTVFNTFNALVGVLAYTGLVWGLVDAVLGDRLTSTFQYPNTAAAFYNTGMILCLVLAECYEKRWQKALFSGMFVLQVIAFFLCRSRIAFMQFAVILLLYILLLPWKNKVSSGILCGVNLIIGMVATRMMQTLFVLAEEAGQIWRHGGAMPFGIRLNIDTMTIQGLALSLGACLVGALLCYGLRPILEVLARKEPSRLGHRRLTACIFGAASLLGLLIIGSLFIPYISEGMRFVLSPFLPPDLINAITNISADDINFTHRIMFIQNGIRIGLTYPILGTGGGGYASVYSMFQPIFSISRFTHSQPFQVLSETGFPGFFAFIAIWAFATWYGMKLLWKSFFADGDDPRHLLMAGLIPAIWAIGAHSTFDFDMTYISIQMWVYALLALIFALTFSSAESFTAPQVLAEPQAAVRSPATGTARRRGQGSPLRQARSSEDASPVIAYIIPIFLAILLAFNAPMVVAEMIYESRFQATTVDELFEIYQRSLRWIGFNNRVLGDYTRARFDQLVVAEDGHTVLLHLERALDASRQAVANDPLNPDVLINYLTCYFYYDNWQEGLDVAFRLLDSSPFWHVGYDLAARIYTSAFIGLTEQGEIIQLRELARQVVTWDEMINNPLHRNNFLNNPHFRPGHVQLAIAMAAFITGDDLMTQRYIDMAIEDMDILVSAALLQAALFHRQGDTENAQEILSFEIMGQPGLAEMFQVMLRWR